MELAPSWLTPTLVFAITGSSVFLHPTLPTLALIVTALASIAFRENDIRTRLKRWLLPSFLANFILVFTPYPPSDDLPEEPVLSDTLGSIFETLSIGLIALVIAHQIAKGEAQLLRRFHGALYSKKWYAHLYDHIPFRRQAIGFIVGLLFLPISLIALEALGDNPFTYPATTEFPQWFVLGKGLVLLASVLVGVAVGAYDGFKDQEQNPKCTSAALTQTTPSVDDC